MRAGRRRDDDDFEGDDVAFVKYFQARVYATFTGLALLLVVAAGEHPEPAHLLPTLLLSVVGIVSAGFVSTVIAPLPVHRALPAPRAWSRLARTHSGAIGPLVAPALVPPAAPSAIVPA